MEREGCLVRGETRGLSERHRKDGVKIRVENGQDVQSPNNCPQGLQKGLHGSGRLITTPIFILYVKFL